jgi:hypothetical protein
VHDDDAVAGEMDVELETVGAEAEPVIEGREGVLRPQRRAAAMGVNERAGIEAFGQMTILTSNPKLQIPSSKARPTSNAQVKTPNQNATRSLGGWFGSWFGIWQLGVPWSLGFGAWDLTSDFP